MQSISPVLCLKKSQAPCLGLIWKYSLRWELLDADNHVRITCCYVVLWNGSFRLKVWIHSLLMTLGTKCTELIIGNLWHIIPVSKWFLTLGDEKEEEEMNVHYSFGIFFYSWGISQCCSQDFKILFYCFKKGSIQFFFPLFIVFIYLIYVYILYIIIIYQYANYIIGM